MREMEEWIRNEKEDLYKIIRLKRNNVIKFIIDNKNNIPIQTIYVISQYKTLLDTIDYLLDERE